MATYKQTTEALLNAPDTNTNVPEVDMKALGSTANSTVAVANTNIKNPPVTTTDYRRTTDALLASPTGTTTEEVSNTISTDELESGVGSGVALPPEPSVTKIDTSVPPPTGDQNIESPDDKFAKENEELDDMRDDIADSIRNVGDIADFEERAGKSVDLQRKRELKTEIDNKIRRKERDLDLALRANEDAFGTRAQKNAKAREITKNYNRELADLSIIQMARAGEFNDAQAYVNRKVELELQSRRANLEALTFIYQENKERFTLSEQRDYEKMLLEEQREYDEEQSRIQSFENMKLSLLQTAINNGAGNATLQNIQSAESMEKLLSVRGIGPQGSGIMSAPTIKNINGRDMQWNGTTGRWEEIDVGAVQENATQTLANLTMLRDASARILGEKYGDADYSDNPLYKASGLSLYDRAQGFLFGDSKYNQLQTYADTLKTNVLTLMTDPSIRDFFGPQMSEADVRLMTSAGSTLRPSSQSKAQLQAEVKRLDDLFNRMETAVRNGMAGLENTGNVITAPDGTQVVITD